MTRITKGALFGLLWSSLLSRGLEAQTIAAASCKASDVQTALNSVSADGTTVTIPSCPSGVAWITPVTYNQVYSTTIIGAGSQSTIGGGDQTVITDNVNHGSTDYTLEISTAAGKSFRLSGITIQVGSGGTTNSGVLQIYGGSQAVRVDHCHFLRNYAAQVRVGGQITGVFDHNIFDQANLGVRIYGTNWGGGKKNNGDGSWADTTTLGSNRFMFFENNAFNGGIANDCYDGGRFVFRYNTFGPGTGGVDTRNSSLQTHPTGGSGDSRGCRAWEIYQNTFSGPNGNPTYNAFFLSAGTGVVWGNTVPAGYETLVSLHSMRRNSTTYSQSDTPNGWGYCGTSFKGTGSNWDRNASTTTGYRCIDQPGQGVGQLLANQFPNKINTVTGTIAWPNQALEPVYEWLNNWTAVAGYPFPRILNTDTTAFTENSDYYVYTSSFNGTGGTGSGLLSARPATCTAGPGGNTPGVVYWATDAGSQGTLYVCNPTNTWTMYYTPYPYPHPLTQGATTTTPPAAPTSLQVIVH